MAGTCTEVYTLLVAIIIVLSKTVETSRIQYIEETNTQIVPNILNVIKSHNAVEQLMRVNNPYEKYLHKRNSLDKNKISRQQRNHVLRQHNLEFIREVPHKENNIKKILVKRRVPKNYIPKLEYDHLAKTLYRPISLQSRPKNYFQRLPKHYAALHLAKLLNVQPSKTSQQPFYHYDKTRLNDLLAKYPIEPRLHLRVKKNYSLRQLLKDVGKEIESKKPSLRIGEEGEKALNNELTTAAPMKYWYPKYSVWNYWTYKKELAQDSCPGNQIKINGECLWLPPHRRFLESLGYQPYD